MLQVHISEHKLGVFIEGDYHDLRMLYKAIEAVVYSGLGDMKASERALYSMMFDTRKAMEGEREFDVFQNQLDEAILQSLPVKDDTSIYYGYYVVLTEMMFILLTLHKVNKNIIEDKYYYYLRMFISLVVNAFEEEGIDNSTMDEWFKQAPTYSLSNYYHQYVEVWTLRLLEANEEERLALVEECLYDMVRFGEAYDSLVDEVNTYAKENSCEPSEITYIDSLENLEY